MLFPLAAPRTWMDRRGRSVVIARIEVSQQLLGFFLDLPLSLGEIFTRGSGVISIRTSRPRSIVLRVNASALSMPSAINSSGRIRPAEPLAPLAVEANVSYIAFNLFDKALELLGWLHVLGSEHHVGLFLGEGLSLVRVKRAQHRRLHVNV